MRAILACLVAGGVACAAMEAGATIYDVEFDLALDDQVLATPIVAGDGIAVRGLITGQSPVDFVNNLTFTAGPGVTRLVSAIAWFDPDILAPFGNLSFSYQLLDTLDPITVIEEDVGPIAGAPGVFSSSLAYTGLKPGVEYILHIHGNIPAGITGNYDLKVAFVPIPAAAALMVPALVGLGLVGRRRRS